MRQEVNKVTGKNILQGHSMEWRVNTHSLLKELIENSPGSMGIFFQPINIFQELLALVAHRSSQLNDPILNALMCRLALYGESDPYDKANYNRGIVEDVLNNEKYHKWLPKAKRDIK